MDDLLAQLSFSPVHSPAVVQPPVVRSPGFEGLPDPGTPPWAHLDEPMSPGEALAFDAPSPPGTPPAAADQTRAGSTAPWGASRPRTNPARPARDFGAAPRGPVASSSAGPSSAPKRPGEGLQGPAATRQRREEPESTHEQPLQGLQWGRQAPRSRPAPPQEQPQPDLRWGRQARRTGPAGRQVPSDSSSSD